MKKPLKILNLSDIHIGHEHTHAEFMLQNIKKHFIEYAKYLKHLDMITITGDVTHKLLPTNSKDYSVFTDLLIFLAKYCMADNIKLRVLEGTKSHDMGQMKNFYKIIKDLQLKVDFKYVDTLSIEYIKDFDMNILYVPDELNHEASVTIEEIKQLLNHHKLTHVNHVLLHGQFNFNAPMKSKVSFNEEEMLSICDGFISCGHIHEFGTYKRIVMTGSFDRHNHGTESKKGSVLFDYGKYENEYIFLENKNAKIYKTIIIKEYNPNELIELVNKLKLPDGSYIRFKTDDIRLDRNVLKDLGRRFPFYAFDNSHLSKENKKTIRKAFESEINELEITSKNIIELVSEELESLNIKDKEEIINELRNHI